MGRLFFFLSGHLRAVSGATALALAAFLALAAIVAGLAAALALAGVLALTGVLFGYLGVIFLVLVLQGSIGCLSSSNNSRGLNSGAAACEQASNRRARNEGPLGLCHG